MKYVFFAACLMTAVLMSGRIDINIEHNLHLPKELTGQTIITSSYNVWPFSKRIDVYLNNEIKDMGAYADVAQALQKLGSHDEVYFHLAGYGGNVLGMTTIVTAINNTKAKVTMLVEAPVFSAHSMLATIPGVKLVVSEHAFLMFHQISALGTDCSSEPGIDRGIPNAEHCEGAVETVIAFSNGYLTSTKYLTKQEVKDIQAGHDIYLSAKTIRDRQHGIYTRVNYIRAPIKIPKIPTIAFISFKGR